MHLREDMCRKTVNADFLMTLLDPVGAITKSSGTMASANTFTFSTKQFEPDVGIGYWGYRWYQPEHNRWLNRDPIGEDGGVNLYVAMANSPVSDVDPDGRWGWSWTASMIPGIPKLLPGMPKRYKTGEAGVVDWNVSPRKHPDGCLPGCSKVDCSGSARSEGWFWPGGEFDGRYVRSSYLHEQEHVRRQKMSWDDLKNDVGTYAPSDCMSDPKASCYIELFRLLDQFHRARGDEATWNLDCTTHAGTPEGTMACTEARTHAARVTRLAGIVRGKRGECASK